MKFKTQTLSFDLSQLQLNRTDEALFKNHYSMLNVKQLRKSIDSLSRQNVKRKKLFRKNFLNQYTLFRKKDTAENKTYETPGSFDTAEVMSIKYPVLNNLRKDGKLRAVDIALRNAKRQKERIVYAKKEADNKQRLIIKHEIVWNQKFRLSLACLIFFFIGAPLGAIIRKGGLGFPVVVSVLVFVFYHVITMLGEKAVITGEWSVFWGMWLSTLLIAPMGLFLTYKATTDAPLLDAESWKRFFERYGLSKIIEKINKLSEK
jgi:lipopolysaccharide export system permease protein